MNKKLKQKIRNEVKRVKEESDKEWEKFKKEAHELEKEANNMTENDFWDIVKDIKKEQKEVKNGKYE